MFFKTAVCKAQITEVKRDSSLIKVASKWADINSFSDRYKSLFANYVLANNIRVGKYDPSFKYYMVIAMHGSVCNDNWDFWHYGSVNNPDEPELLRFDKNASRQVYQSFIGRGNYKNHDNDDVAKAVGIILDVMPNHDDKSILALLAVDTQKDQDLLRGIEAGYIDSVSMGCLCGHSLCSVCGNLAHNEREYCDHLKYHKGQVISHNGQYVRPYEDNRDCSFIELSWVGVPADRNAKLLNKVATVSLSDEAMIMYEAMKQTMNDARMVTSSLDEYTALLSMIKNDIEQENI